MTLPFQRVFHFLSFCLCLSLYLLLVSPLSFLLSYIPVFLQREVSVMILHFRHLECALADTNTILSSHSVLHIHMCVHIFWAMLLLLNHTSPLSREEIKEGTNQAQESHQSEGLGEGNSEEIGLRRKVGGEGKQ